MLNDNQGRGEPRNDEEKALLRQRMYRDRVVAGLCLALAVGTVLLLRNCGAG